MGYGGGKCCDGGDADVGSGARGRVRCHEHDHRQPDVPQDEADKTTGNSCDEAPKCDSDEDESVQPLEYRR